MFEIYVNNKLVLQQHVAEAKTAQTLSWNQSNPNDEIYIRYSHCGVTGKKRNITIKNDQHRTLRSWQFADSPEKNMICKMKDFIELQKSDGTLYIYYSSQELPTGKLLATIN